MKRNDVSDDDVVVGVGHDFGFASFFKKDKKKNKKVA